VSFSAIAVARLRAQDRWSSRTRGETRGAQHPERIITKKDVGVDRCAQHPILKVMKALKVIEERLDPGASSFSATTSRPAR